MPKCCRVDLHAFNSVILNPSNLWEYSFSLKEKKKQLRGKQVDTIYIYTGKILGTVLIRPKCCLVLQHSCEWVIHKAKLNSFDGRSSQTYTSHGKKGRRWIVKRNLWFHQKEEKTIQNYDLQRTSQLFYSQNIHFQIWIMALENNSGKVRE